jgi:hypothetical protein
MAIRLLLSLILVAAAAPAWAGETETAGPIQAVIHDFGGRPVLAYFTRGAGTCDAVLMTHQDLGPRVRVRLLPDQAATIEDVSGGTVKLTCGADGSRMVVERTPAPVAAASIR